MIIKVAEMSAALHFEIIGISSDAKKMKEFFFEPLMMFLVFVHQLIEFTKKAL